MPAEEKYKWNIEGLDEKHKEDLREKVEIESSRFSGHEDFHVQVDKNPKGGAFISVTDTKGKIILEGRYQNRRFPGTSIVWGENPRLGIHRS